MAGTLECLTFNVLNGELIRFPLSEWLHGNYFRKYTLVLYGDSDLGKTEYAKSLLAACALKLQTSELQRNNPYFIKVGTVDVLRECKDKNLMHENVPILFDEVVPGHARGSGRACHSLDDLKLLSEIRESSVASGRNNDISFHQKQPRIFAFNGKCPNDFHHELYADDVWSKLPDIRRGYSSDVKAVFKRCCFVHVNVSMISVEMREAYDAALLASDPA
jgi:hypothetical protein